MMSYRYVHISILTAIILFVFQSCSPKHSEIVVAEYGNKAITMGEFEKAYAKNVGGIEKAKDDSLENYKNFLNLFVNFKMKLSEADARAFNLDENLNKELNDYKKQVGVTYILEKLFIEPNIKHLWEDRKWELRVSHLMVRPDSTGDENARLKAEELLERVQNGESFEYLVNEYSDDVFSKPTGDIFYITKGMIVPEFEDAAYRCPVGGVLNEVVKTQYGYHLVKVTDKRERIPSIKASHIMIDFYDDDGKVDSAAAFAKISELKARIDNGEDFATLAALYSEDQGTKETGGDLGYFSRRMMVKEFDEAAFNLQVGQVSGIVKTNYGYHIIKLTGKKDYPTFEQDKEELKQIYKQLRYKRDLDTLNASLRKKYNLRINDSFADYVTAVNDSFVMNDNFYNSEFFNQISDSAIFKANNSISVRFGDVIEKAKTTYEFGNMKVDKELIEKLFNKYESDYLLECEAVNLEAVNAEFASLMEDYRNGIYIFKLQEDEVWNKIDIDSAKLAAHYEKTKEKYVWNDRVEFAEIFVYKDSVINKIYDKLVNGEDFEELAVLYTERPGYKDKAGRYPLTDVNNSLLSKEANKLNIPGDFSTPFPNTGGYSIVKLIKKDPSRIKTFEEARAEVSGSFQEYESKRLENEFIEKLKMNYKPKYFYERLSSAYRGED